MPYTERDRREQQEYYDAVMQEFGGNCVVCYPAGNLTGVTVHEIVSRSKLPKSWWKDTENGCPLCQPHHTMAEDMPTKQSQEYCRLHKEKARRIMRGE